MEQSNIIHGKAITRFSGGYMGGVKAELSSDRINLTVTAAETELNLEDGNIVLRKASVNGLIHDIMMSELCDVTLYNDNRFDLKVLE